MTTTLVNNLPAFGRTEASTWEIRQKRAVTLAERYPFAEEILRFYYELVNMQEIIWQKALAEKPSPENAAEWAAQAGLMARIIEVAQQAGPELLAEAAFAVEEAGPELQHAILRAYLADVPLHDLEEELVEPARFLARATLGPVLEALDLESSKTTPLTGDERRCPWCWGKPQVRVIAESEEGGAPAYLVCGRCSRAWKFHRRTCAACGERRLNQIALFEAVETFPHLRVEGCRTCEQYTITVDRRKDGQAEPLVDEMCALPLDLWASEQGFSKVLANLMGV